MAHSPTPAPSHVPREIRAEAQRQAKSLSLKLVLLVGTVAALFSVAAIALLDYQFGQAPHRLIKLLIGVSLMAWIVIRPRIGLFVIPVVTPFLPWIPPVPVPGVNAQNVLLGTVFVTWAIGRVFNREPVFRGGRLGVPIFAFVAVAGLSVVRGAAFPTGYVYEGGDAGIQLFRAAVTFATYYVALAMARGPRDRRILGWSVVLALFAEALVTILYGRSGHGGRAVGSIGQSNDLGAFLALYTPLALAFVPAVRNWAGKLLLLSAVGLGLWATVFSLSRGALVALGIGLLYVSFRSSRVLTMLLVAVMLASPLWAPDYLKERVMETQVEAETTDEVALDNASQLRVDTWRAIVEIVTDHPLDGVGFAGLGYVLPAMGTALGVEVKDSSHNTYLRCLAEMGILGLLLFVFILWRSWRLAGAARLAAENAFDRQLAVGLGAMALSLAITCAFGDRFFNVLVTGNFWIMCALANDLLLERRAAAGLGPRDGEPQPTRERLTTPGPLPRAGGTLPPTPRRP